MFAGIKMLKLDSHGNVLIRVKERGGDPDWICFEFLSGVFAHSAGKIAVREFINRLVIPIANES